MFPGSLQLGKWRIRGDDQSGFFLERFDDDGTMVTNAWFPITTWGFDTETNAANMSVDTLGVTSGIKCDTLVVGPNELGLGTGLAAYIDGKLRTTDHLETAGKLRADTLAPFFQGAVRVETGLNVEGNLAASGSLTVGGTNVLAQLGGKQDQLTQEGFGTGLLYDSNKLKQLQFGSGIVGGTDVQPDGSQNVSISVDPGLLASKEPAFTAVAPLQKVVNLQTGQLEMRVNTTGLEGLNPVFCGGRVDGATASPLSSIGRVGYTVARPSGQAQGIWTITFDSPAASHTYTVQLTNMNFGTTYLWDQMPSTVQGFTVVVVGLATTPTTLRNAPFHFTVFT
jgi:hypothetical protein